MSQKGILMKFIDNHFTKDLLDAYCRRNSHVPGKMNEVTIHPGTMIIEQGKSPDCVFIILHGSMKIHISTAKGTEYLVAIEGKGELLGEVEGLTGDPATCSVTALSESLVAKISPDAYKSWLEDDHDFALLVNRILSYRLQQTTKRAAVHLTYPLEYSVLKLLKMQAAENSVHITKEEIANYLGTSIRSVNRILKDLQNKNVLSPSKEIEIVSMDNLEQAMRNHEE